MHAPQIIWIIIMAMTLGIYATEHGKPQTGNYSFWTALIGVGIQIGLLYWGGFFG